MRNLIREHAALAPARNAILAPGRPALRYGPLASFLADVQEALARSGLDAGARAVLVTPNGPEAATAFLALASFGACAPLNPAYREEEYRFYLSDLRPDAVILQAERDHPVLAAAAALEIPVLRIEALPGEPAGVFRITGGPSARGARRDGQGAGRTALLLHTSGTTSRPKLVPLTEANLVASAGNVARVLELTPTDCCLNVMPLFHIHGLVAALLASLRAGGAVVCCPGFQAPRFLSWLAETEATWCTAVPTIHQSVLDRVRKDRGATRNPRLRFFRSSSAALAPAVMAGLEDVFSVPVVEAYGMTEAAHQVASNPLPPGVRKAGSVGFPAGPEIAILNARGETLGRGQAGEVAIRGANVTSGYEDNVEANAASFHHGWFRTGDEGRFDDDGYLVLTGRLKEMINRGGEKIAPREIDETLLRHPRIVQAVAFAVPDARLGERVAAAVVVDGSEGVTERELRRYTGEFLADFKVPERILIVPEIPKGPTGKIQRVGLAQRLGLDRLESDGEAGGGHPDSPPVDLESEIRIRRLFQEVLEIEAAGPDTGFFTSGGDSVLATVLLARLRAECGSDVSYQEFLEAPTSRGLAALARRTGRADTAGVTESLMLVQRGHPEAVIFCVPGAFGQAAGFGRLGRHLGPDWTLYLFDARSVARGSGAFSVEELAGRLADGIAAVRPEGPCMLAGACFGGLVAYEAARMLRASGREVGALILLDSFNPRWAADLSAAARWGSRGAYAAMRLGFHLRNLAVRPPWRWRAYLGPRFAMFRRRVAEERDLARYRELLAAGRGIPPELNRLQFASWEAARRYRPGPYDGPLTLVQAREPRQGGNRCPLMGWDRLAAGPTMKFRVAGNHASILREPSVSQVAERLCEALLNGGAAPGGTPRG